MIQARTGTGKTAAFAIPLIDRRIREKTGVQLIALCPTRELALQVASEMESIGRHRGFKVVAIYGGASINKQIQQLEEGVHAVVGTPGRVLDHLRRRTLVVGNVKFLILDEADEMLSMGFEKEISSIIEQLPEERQTLLFSATIPPEAQRLAQRYMKDPEVISLSDDYVGAKEVNHAFFMVSGSGRINDLIRVIDIEDPESAMIFCNTRDDVQLVAGALKRHGYNVDWISSDLTQADREIVMGRMKEGKSRFLVATDVAARGIDISHVTHVINYTFPEALDVYIHRTGRTGRMGRTGWAISLITPRDVGNLYFLKLTYKITPIERELPTEGEIEAQRESDLLSTLVSSYRKDLDDNLLSLARRVLTHARGTEIVATLLGKYVEERPEAAAEGEADRHQRQGDPAFDYDKRPGRRSSSSRGRTDQGRDRQRSPRSREAGDSQKPRSPRDSNGSGDGRNNSSQEENAEQVKEIYLNVGRRNGVRASEIAQILDESGIGQDLVDKIRIRERSTFVGVRADRTESALEALNGATLGDRVAMAEPAKRSRS